MYLTGFADEASSDIDGQIKATQMLGWNHIEARSINDSNILELSDGQFEAVLEKLVDSGIQVNCIGSSIANWAKNVSDNFENTINAVRQAIPRMQRMRTSMIRIMSYAINREQDQMEKERFRRLKIIKKIFDDAGILTLHENCQNYGGMSYLHTLRLIDNVPGLKLVFDTGNPVFSDDYSKHKPYPKQNSWEFYSAVKEHIKYLHIKDCIWDTDQKKVTYVWPGEGHGYVHKILQDMLRTGYDSGISIEPHIASVYHEKTVKSNVNRFNTYVEYGKRLKTIIAGLKSV